ncbi:MAG: hypothetical protein ACI4M6_06860 [Christensenellaceae bacterium]
MLNLLSAYQFTSLGLQWGSFVFILGMAVIFFGVGVIVLVVSIIGKLMPSILKLTEKISAVSKAFFSKLGGLFKKKKPEASADTAEAVETDLVTPEIKAAIIAAISCYYMNQDSKCEFKVKKIKRI